jgi:hypothetical protein
MSDLESKDWRELSEAASREKDPQRLMELIRALNKALERREQEERNGSRTAPAILQMRRTAQMPGRTGVDCAHAGHTVQA